MRTLAALLSAICITCQAETLTLSPENGMGNLNSFSNVATDNPDVTVNIVVSNGYSVTFSDLPNVDCMGAFNATNTYPCYDMTGVVFAPGYPQPRPLGYSISLTIAEHVTYKHVGVCSGRACGGPRAFWSLDSGAIVR